MRFHGGIGRWCAAVAGACAVSIALAGVAWADDDGTGPPAPPPAPNPLAKALTPPVMSSDAVSGADDVPIAGRFVRPGGVLSPDGPMLTPGGVLSADGPLLMPGGLLSPDGSLLSPNSPVSPGAILTANSPVATAVNPQCGSGGMLKSVGERLPNLIPGSTLKALEGPAANTAKCPQSAPDDQDAPPAN